MFQISDFLVESNVLHFSLSLCVSGADLLIIQAMYSRERIFSKPSPSTEVPASSQPRMASWHAGPGPLEVEDFLLLRYSKKERDGALLTETKRSRLEFVLFSFSVSGLFPN